MRRICCILYLFTWCTRHLFQGRKRLVEGDVDLKCAHVSFCGIAPLLTLGSDRAGAPHSMSWSFLVLLALASARSQQLEPTPEPGYHRSIPLKTRLGDSATMPQPSGTQPRGIASLLSRVEGLHTDTRRNRICITRKPSSTKRRESILPQMHTIETPPERS